MIVVDVNVLLAAFRADHTHHQPARRWLEETLTTGRGILIPDLAWVGFVRLVTNSHIFEVPSTPTEAFDFVEAVCSAPTYAGVSGLAEGTAAFRDTVISADAWGNLIPDAYLAAIAVENAASVVSFDRDFRRFDGIEILVPGS